MPTEQPTTAETPLLRYHLGLCTPMELLQRPELSDRDKLAVLRQWEHDAIELMVADEENMGGGHSAPLSDIREAMRRLTAADDQTPDADGSETMVREVMTRSVKTVHADNRIREVALQMAEFNVGLYVVLDGETVAGIVTDRDITVRAVAHRLDPDTHAVADVMTNRVVACSDRAPIAEAADIMTREGLRRLCVVDEGGGLVGLVSLTDLALGANGDATIGRVLRAITRSPASGGPDAGQPSSRHTESNQPGGLHVYSTRPVVRT
ncbi:CBS domain-containing protein [uncultured Rhodospira sp.]|uniref:CBS domain-containing protein n=1 Tax=uncultured Rhodospira sp. TaxID=1936189 RepID=UPI002606DF2F|nr:CBS domain-containing protein [uncultured Rhodospira sp.]